MKKDFFNIGLFINSWRIYKQNFVELFTSAIAVITVFLGCFVLYTYLGAYDFGLTGILLFAFVFIPLLYSFQILIAIASSGARLHQYQLYFTFLDYYHKRNFGIYSMIKNLIFTFIVLFIGLNLSLIIYDLVYPGTYLGIYNQYQEGLIAPENLYIEVFSMKNYLFFLLPFILLTFLAFFKFVKKQTLVIYFNIMVNVPKLITKNVFNRFYSVNKKYIHFDDRLNTIICALSFSLGFLMTGIILLLIDPGLDLATIITSSLLVGSLLASISLSPLMICGCFSADRLHALYLESIKMTIVKMSQNAFKQKGFEEVNENLKKYISDIEKALEEQNRKRRK